MAAPVAITCKVRTAAPKWDAPRRRPVADLVAPQICDLPEYAAFRRSMMLATRRDKLADSASGDRVLGQNETRLARNRPTRPSNVRPVGARPRAPSHSAERVAKDW